MKKILFSLAMILAIGISSESFANHTFTSTLKSEDGDPFRAQVLVRSESMKLDVFVEPAENEHVKISLLDAEGRTLATKRVHDSENVGGIRFDVSNLKDGIYQVEITDGTTRQVESVALATFQPQRSLSFQ